MNKQQEALKLALEAMTYADACLKKQLTTKDKHEYAQDLLLEAGTAIREALADSALDRMADNARELGLDYEPIVEQVEDFVGMGHKAWDMVDPKELAKGFHEALAEPPCKTGSQCTNKCQQCEQPAKQQESVEYWTVADGWVSEQAEVPAAAWIYPEFWDHCKMVGCGTAYRLPGDGRQPLYTSPPASKPWVGLTDEERREIGHPYFSSVNMSDVAYARAIEAKLREKNS